MALANLQSRSLAAGDLVLFRDPDPKVATRGHTGRVVAVRPDQVTVAPTGSDRNRRIPLSHVEGWWPKGAHDRSLQALRRL